jgi:hypothetical protein
MLVGTMRFSVDDALAVLARTPGALDALLRGLPERWTACDEGGSGWSPFEVLGHLIHGEETDWMARARRLLEHGETLPFDPFDREAQKHESRGKTLDELLDRFTALRAENLAELRSLALGEGELGRRGRHPALGTVTLRELLATWVVHDLGHLRQIARAMAKEYAGEVGPWEAYLPVLRERGGDSG